MPVTTIPKLDPAIRIESTDVGVRYILPNRILGLKHLLGLFPLLLGCLFVGIPLIVIFHILNQWLKGGQFLSMPLLFAFFGLFFLLIGLLFIAIGLATLFPNHSEIILQRNAVLVREIGGPIRWTFRCPKNRITGLQLIPIQDSTIDIRSTSNAKSIGNSASRYIIRIEGKFRTLKYAASGYSKELLTPLICLIAQHCDVPIPTSVLVEIATTPDTLPLKPNHSPITLVQTDSMTTISIPSPGFKSPMGHMFRSGFSWVFLCFIIFGFILYQELTLTVLLIAVAFVMAGIAMILISLNFITQRNLLIATPDQLIWSKSSLFGKREKYWDTANLRTLATGFSNYNTEDTSLPELHIFLHNGKKIALFYGRPADELEWLAAYLRHALKLPRN